MSKKIRDLMPRGYIKTLHEKTGRSAPYIIEKVKNEDTQSPIWPDVLELAKATEKKRKRLEAATNRLLKS